MKRLVVADRHFAASGGRNTGLRLRTINASRRRLPDLQSEETTAQALETFRSLVSRVDFVPEGGTLAILPRGDLATILQFGAGTKKPRLPFESRGFGRPAIAGNGGCGDRI